MLSSDLFQTALKGVTVNITRSALTMLGIIIGVGAVVLMSSIGASMQQVILGQISSLGAKSMVIFPGREEGGAGQVMAGFDSLTFEDLAELKKIDSISNLAPLIFMAGPVSYGREEASSQIMGVTTEFFTNQTIEADIGRIIEEPDINGASFVAVLGPDAARNLFGQRSPLGMRIRVGNNHFTVVGVTKPLGSQFFQNADDRVYVPFSVARQVTGQKHLNQITMLATRTFDEAFVDVRYLLRRRHGINNPKNDLKKDDFVVHSSEEANQILGGVSLGLTMFITTIAAISLFVGGIGIMNIMLVSVTERTREIGLRKALGAKRRDILLQFLAESVLLTFIGGAIGVMGGIFLAFVTAAFVRHLLASYYFVVSYTSIAAAFIMAALTGLFFGIAPAKKAASLHPIEALRYE